MNVHTQANPLLRTLALLSRIFIPNRVARRLWHRSHLWSSAPRTHRTFSQVPRGRDFTIASTGHRAQVTDWRVAPGLKRFGRTNYRDYFSLQPERVSFS